MLQEHKICKQNGKIIYKSMHWRWLQVRKMETGKDEELEMTEAINVNIYKLYTYTTYINIHKQKF